MRYSCWIATAILSLLLSSCSIFSPVNTPKIDTYEINTIPSVPVSRSSHSTIAVMQPESSAIYNTTEIAYTIAAYQVAYFARSRWIDTPPRMLQQLMIQTLQNTHHFKAVMFPTFTGHIDYVLSSQLVKLEQDFSVNPSLVKMIVRAQLLDAKTSRVLAVKQISVVVPAPQNTPYGGVMAANQAAADIVRQIAQFSLRTH